MRIPRCVVFLLLLVLAVPVSGQDLQAVIDECEACHGPNGMSAQDDIPSVAGMDPAKLQEALMEFYYFERHCTTTTYRYGDRPKTPLNMCNVATTLGDEDRVAIAEHFANR